MKWIVMWNWCPHCNQMTDQQYKWGVWVCTHCNEEIYEQEQKMKRPKIDPMIIELNELFLQAVQHKPILPVTAFCIDLAKTAMGWEFANNAKMARKEINKRIKNLPT